MKFRPKTVSISQRVTIAAMLAAGALVSVPAAAGGLLLYEVGTEDIGLAAAGYAARAQDATTVFTNPAGMTRLDGQQFEVGADVLYSNLKFSPGSGTSPGLGTDDGGHATGSSGWFGGGGLFYSYSVSRDLKLGFASTGNFGASLKYNDNWVGRYYAKRVTLIGASLLPSVAYRVNDKLSVGASVNAMYGYLKDETAVNNVADGMADGNLSVDDSKWGWGGNLGVLYEFSPDTRVGLTYSSEVKLDFSGPAKFSGLGPGLSAILGATGVLNAPIKLGLKVPQQVMGSAFHKVNDRWAVLGNVGWQQWSKFGEAEVSVDKNNPTSFTTNVPLKDTWHGALGAQYQMSDPWRLNLGVAYDSAFQPGDTVSLLLPANSAWRFGIGAQKQVRENFNWGVAAEYIYGGTLDVSHQSTLPVALGGRGDVVGSYDNIGTVFVSANFNWKF